MDAASYRLAAGLLGHGLALGGSVALQLPKAPQFFVAYFGILKAGCVVVPMNVLITWAKSAAEEAKGAADAGVLDVAVLTPAGMPSPPPT